MKIFYYLLFILFISSCKKKQDLLTAQYANSFIYIDGLEDFEWGKVPWEPINNVWVGNAIDSQDFWGAYKLLWNENYLFVLAKIHDDKLTDIHLDGLNKYWDDDCLEIFIDEDASGGNHQYNHQAFAYHLSMDGQAVDIDIDSNAKYFDHCFFDIDRTDKTLIWEVAIKLYDNSYKYNKKNNPPVKLLNNKIMGFSIAYNDNDSSSEREHMIGSVPIDRKDKNVSWINSDYFGKIILDGPTNLQ